MAGETEFLLLSPQDVLGFRLQFFLYNHPAWLRTLSLGALFGDLRSSLVASLLPTYPATVALPAHWAPLTQISVSLLGFIIIEIVIFTSITLAFSHFINMHVVSPKSLSDLLQFERLETWRKTLAF